MSKKVYVVGVQPEPGSPVFGRVDDPVQIQKAQDYAHDHTNRITKDFLVAGANAPQVSGFLATLTGGLKVSIAAGNAIDTNGVHYQLDDPFEVTLNAADPAHARIDLIYATLEEDVEANSELTLFRQLRTLEQLEAGTDPFVPTQFNQPTELHSRSSIAVHTGVPGVSPAAPAAGAGEVPLWQVHVGAGAVALAGGDLTSVRALMTSLYQALVRLIALEAIITDGLGAGLTEFVQDVVGALITSPDGTVTINYNDASNLFTLSINNAALTEKIQDVFGAALSSPDSSITATYNDAGNIETIVLAAGYKAMLDSATSAAAVGTLVRRASDKGIALDGHSQIGPVLVGPGGSLLDIQQGTNGELPLINIYKFNPTAGESGHCMLIAGNCNGVSSSLHGVLEVDDWNTAGASGTGALIRAMGVQGAAATLAFRVLSKGDVFIGRDLQVVGTLSKGAGTFDIDHPLDPENKDLVYSFIEGPRPYLLFSGTTKLQKGRAIVDLDAEANQMAGTFAALTQNAHGQAWNESDDEDNFDRVRLVKIEDGKATIKCENSDADFEVGWSVTAERNDAFIRACHLTDDDGQWIVERTKEESDPSLLQPETRIVRAQAAAPDRTYDEVLTELVGKRGFPRHAQATGVGAVPKRSVTIKTELVEKKSEGEGQDAQA